MTEFCRKWAKRLVVVLVVVLSPLLAAPVLLSIYLKVRFSLLEPADFDRGGRASTPPPSAREVAQELDRIPFSSRIPAPLAIVFVVATDLVVWALNCYHRTAGLLFPYPATFQKVVINADDGTPISGMLGLQSGGVSRPALILVHGLFDSKNSSYLLYQALKAYYRWGFHVLTVDLRGHGTTAAPGSPPSGGGAVEAGDILAAARYLKNLDQVGTVGLCGFSFGAATSLLASALSGDSGLLDGGVVACNGFGDSRPQVNRISKDPLFRGMLQVFSGLKVGMRCSSFGEYFEEVSAPYYGCSTEDLYRDSSAVLKVAGIQTPTLVIHSEDDPVIPVEEALKMSEAARDNPMVGFLIKPEGSHDLYLYTSAAWFSQVLRTFLSHWASCD